jgi:hypothetical protein
MHQPRNLHGNSSYQDMALAISLEHKNWMGFSPTAPEGGHLTNSCGRPEGGALIRTSLACASRPKAEQSARNPSRNLTISINLRIMAYHVVALTMAQVRQGALQFQRDLGAALHEANELKVYSASPFDLEERRRLKDRFGGDVVYFFNDAARNLSLLQGLDLNFIAEIADTELPRRRTIVVGLPE